MSHKDAYDEAIQFIMQDPEHNICEITWWLGWGYTLKCWTSSDTTPTTFSHRLGYHALFFSKMLFKWKDHVRLQRRMTTPCLISKVIPSGIQGKAKDEYFNSYPVRHLRFINAATKIVNLKWRQKLSAKTLSILKFLMCLCPFIT